MRRVVDLLGQLSSTDATVLTLFLDEIAELPPASQAKLLRVLQERQVERVGAVRSVAIDLRILAASNQDLRQLVAQRRFRNDLYYRLDVITIQAPRSASVAKTSNLWPTRSRAARAPVGQSGTPLRSRRSRRSGCLFQAGQCASWTTA